MYGNRDAGHNKFISPVVKGGIDYGKSILDTYTRLGNALDSGIEDIKPTGYTPHDKLYVFTINLKIKCFGYDIIKWNNFDKWRI